MRLADVVMSIPGIILLLIVLALFSQSMTAVMLAVGLLSCSPASSAPWPTATPRASA